MKRILALLALLCVSAFAQDSVKVGENTVHITVVRDGRTIYDATTHNLITTGGKDWLAKVMSATTSAPGQAYYIAVSTDATSPAAADCAAGSTTCTLTSEVNSNGVARAAATFAHTDGQNTYTLTKQWTATGAIASVQKAAVFTASSSGTMVFETAFPASPGPVTLANQDLLTITWTVTLN